MNPTEASAEALNAWHRYNAERLREALPRPSLVRRVARALAPVVGPVLVVLAPPLGLVLLSLVHR